MKHLKIPGFDIKLPAQESSEVSSTPESFTPRCSSAWADSRPQLYLKCFKFSLSSSVSSLKWSLHTPFLCVSVTHSQLSPTRSPHYLAPVLSTFTIWNVIIGIYVYSHPNENREMFLANAVAAAKTIKIYTGHRRKTQAEKFRSRIRPKLTKVLQKTFLSNPISKLNIQSPQS